MYTLGFFLMTIAAWIMSRWGGQIPGIPLTATCDAACWQYLAVDRITLGFVLYHSLLCLLMLGVKSSQDVRAHFQNGWWPLKAAMLLGSIVGCFFIPAQHLETYFIATFVFAALFIIIQSMLLVDFAWNWSSRLLEKWEAGDGGVYKFLLVAITLGSYLLVLVFTILLYVFFTSNPGCQLNTFFVTFNLLVVLAMTFVSILPRVQEANPRSGLFQAAILSVFITYLIGSAIASQPPDVFQCRKFGVPTTNGTLAEDPLSRTMLFSGIFITFVAVGYQAFSTGTSSDQMFGGGAGGEDGKLEDDEVEEVSYNYSWFHFVFVLAGMYIAAVLTNWAGMVTTGGNATPTLEVNYGLSSMWIKVSTSWLVGLLYIWTLVAPVCSLLHGVYFSNYRWIDGMSGSKLPVNR